MLPRNNVGCKQDGFGKRGDSVQQEVKTQRNIVTANDLEETRGDTVYVQKQPAERGVHCSPSHIHYGEQEDKGQGHQNKGLGEIYTEVISAGGHNYDTARVPVPSGLSIAAWRRYLEGYTDQNLPDLLEFGWPVHCQPTAILQPTYVNHPSARQFEQDIKYYIELERGFGALGGPYDTQPFTFMQVSPLMTRTKKDSIHRRVIMDLSWPPDLSVNDAIQGEWYVDGKMSITLPTVDYMEGRLLQLGRGAYLYKTDLARGYRQLRVDPADWPLLGFTHEGKYYFDLCPPFGLRTSALCMQRTSEAISWIHGKRGFLSRPYLDDFGGGQKPPNRGHRGRCRNYKTLWASWGSRKRSIRCVSQPLTWYG